MKEGYTLKFIAEKLSARLSGDPDEKIIGVSSFESAESGTITFASRKEYFKKLNECRASAIIVPDGIVAEGKNLLYVQNPISAFVETIKIFHPPKKHKPGISPWAIVSNTARIAKTATIYPFAYVGNETTVGENTVIYPGAVILERCRIGDECTIFPNVTIYDGCIIGNKVRIHSGTVIGSDGFGYYRDSAGHVKIPQVGAVQIEDDVEIGANCTIDRATLGMTIIKRGTKIDNLVHIGHNVKVGERVILVAQVGISGSTEIGSDSILAGQVGVVDHVRIGNNVIVGAQSGVAGDIKDSGMFMGSPAVPHSQWLKYVSILPRLPELRKKIMDLEKEVERLKEKTLKENKK